MLGFSWLVGGGALAAYLWTRQRAHTSTAKPLPVSTPLTGRWVWPVASWNGRSPVISDGFGSPRPGGARHGGVDVMFARLPGDALRAATPNGSKHHVMPDDIAVLAAADGVVWSAMKTPRGHAVVIDHAPHKVATFYAHLDTLLVTPTSRGVSKQRVRAGQVIGTVGFSPLDSQKLKHLHFELWQGGPTNVIDPAPVMRDWVVAPDPRAAQPTRNAGFVYRALGERGDAYPQWVRDLKGKSGVYVIRDATSHEILYVGSSSGRLYDTLTRHFQTVRHEVQEVPMT